MEINTLAVLMGLVYGLVIATILALVITEYVERKDKAITMPKQTKAEKMIDSRIEKAYRASCCNIQVKTLMDLGKVFEAGKKLISEGADDSTLASGLRQYVDLLSKK